MTVNNNLNSMLASELQISDLASKMTQIADVVADPQFQEVTADLIDSIAGQIPEVISYQANAQGVQTQNAVADVLLNIKA
jgi:O6-methylguanine-DNA--protein-cysteine methyltransferase